MREARLRWYGHLKRRCIDKPMKRCDKLVIKGTRKGRGRPKKYCVEVIKQDMMHLHAIEDMALNRKLRKTHITVKGQQGCFVLLYLRWLVFSIIVVEFIIGNIVFFNVS